MGRGSGNAETEYLLAYLKINVENTFSLSNLLDSLNTMKKKVGMGTFLCLCLFSDERFFSS